MKWRRSSLLDARVPCARGFLPRAVGVLFTVFLMMVLALLPGWGSAAGALGDDTPGSAGNWKLSTAGFGRGEDVTTVTDLCEYGGSSMRH
ncbi:MAG: hypothetical protein KKB90_12900 [Actinobacteria bacterium]|nr:hypothetical protein [Actinomycetota bacterium]MCG2820191.1 hypothetical protein [Actinomycetes bacterium]MBU4219837.1 hypothetical protein [Actinomycetota bacterium]MBU4357731.1 hypothetical protein [Actinomycetota bacterium]MBU4393267.1 hypothetical protein [Actinomycetota bacterium]